MIMPRGAKGRRKARRLMDVMQEACHYMMAKQYNGDYDHLSEEELYNALTMVIQSFTYNFLRGKKHESPKALPQKPFFVLYEAYFKEGQENRKARVAPKIEISVRLASQIDKTPATVNVGEDESNWIFPSEIKDHEETIEALRKRIAQSCAIPEEMLFGEGPETGAAYKDFCEKRDKIVETIGKAHDESIIKNLTNSSDKETHQRQDIP